MNLPDDHLLLIKNIKSEILRAEASQNSLRKFFLATQSFIGFVLISRYFFGMFDLWHLAFFCAWLAVCLLVLAMRRRKIEDAKEDLAQLLRVEANELAWQIQRSKTQELLGEESAQE